MITDMLRWGGPPFPDRQLVARVTGSAPRFVLNRRTLTLAASAAAAGGVLVALAFFGAGYFRYSGIAVDEHVAALHAENANVALQDELSRLRDQLGTLSDEAQAHRRQSNVVEHQLAATEQASSTNADRIAQLSRALDQSQRQLHQTEAERVTLMARLSKAEADLADAETQKSQQRASVTESQARLQQLQAEHDRAAAELEALKAKINRLEQKSSMLHTPTAPNAAVASADSVPRQNIAAPKAVPLSAAPRPAPRATTAAYVVAPRRARGFGAIDDIEHVLASAGIDVDRLFSQFGVSRGEGGPFVPVPQGGVPSSTLTAQRLAALRVMVSTLPVSAPLDKYTIASPFGARRDPFNGRPEFHTGIDFDAPYMSPVYSTAAGVVTYAGYRSDYGKVVEISHGHGISTRYAHLHRYTVAVGEHVAAHTEIGLLGTTGRSTGPHVLYEVLVNGDPQNPAKFMALGNDIMVAER